MTTTEKASELYAASFAQIAKDEDAVIAELREFLKIPGFSCTGEGIQESAQKCKEYLEMIGAKDVTLVDTGGYPVVYGRSMSSNPNAKTLAIYSLYDETPVDAAEWTVPPLSGEIVKAEVIGLPASFGDVICSRATNNHRGPMLSTILGVKSMLDAEGDLPCNILWMWEGEEEIGSPNLGNFIKQYQDELAECTALYGPSMFQESTGAMPTYRGVKGALHYELRCRGGEWGGTLDGRHTWSGYVPWVDAPMMRLVQALATLVDDDHNMAIDGVQELIPLLPESDLAEIREIEKMWTDDLDDMLRAQTGVKTFRGGKSSARTMVERWLTCAGLNIQGIAGGYTGPNFYSHLPQDATAKIDMRLPMGLAGADVQRLLREHLDRCGFAEITIDHIRGYDGYRVPVDDPVVQAALKAAEMNGAPNSIWPTTNACCPSSIFAADPMNLPSVWAGLGHGGRAHSPDEYICVDAVKKQMEYTVTYLHEWSKTA